MEKKRYIVTDDGVVENVLKDGDRILRKKSAEFLEDRFVINYNDYITVNVAELKPLVKDLDKNERMLIMALLPYVQYSTCLVCHNNGKSIGTEDVPELAGISRNLAYETLASLIRKDILYKGKNSKEVQYFMNPWITRKGRNVNKVLKTMFRNYYIRSLKCRVKNLEE